MNLVDLDFLTSSAGADLLQRLAHEDLSEGNTLTLLTRLRRDYPPDHAGAALETARLRLKAVDKFDTDAARLFFTRDALEQASDPLIRAYRVQEMSGVGGHVLDVCCGIGSDALAFAAQADSVSGLDIDPVRVAVARLNADVLGLSNTRFEITDVTQGIGDTAGTALIFYDPARRSHDKRIYDVEGYIPPLSLINNWHAPHMMAKLSPGVDLDQLAHYRDDGGEVEFISVDGDLKEAVLHLREGQTPPVQHHTVTATLITTSQILHWRKPLHEIQHRLSPPRAWLIEPDPALIRAGLVEDAALRFDGYQLDQTIAYLTADAHPGSPWARAWRVLDWMPFNLKKLRAHLREHQIGRVTVKKRGSPLTPEGLTAQLKLKGSGARTLVLTRAQGEPIVIVCEEQPTPS